MKALKYSAYPVTMAISFAIFLGLLNFGASLVITTYLALFCGIGLIVLFEQKIPYRAAWIPGKAEFFDDALYALIVQVLLPKFLTFAAMLGLVALNPYKFGNWPHHWGIAAQVILLMLFADLLRYWVHRGFHSIPILWRLHEVHHSSHRLYWLNTSRFHPLEKAIQFLFDSLPFIVLGVSEQVLAVYFVFYAINGFYQHSNVDARLGWLNYLISGPELHRWHHSIQVEESDTNYGNNLIIWDVIFGTRFLPESRAVKVLGIHKSNYPAAFTGQLLAPFRRWE